MKYRPEIDGLRAIAVLLVFVFHLFPTLCTGGFIGVDVFFVISGFLITKIIHDKLVIGNFSFLDFYQRRVLRIFPALFALLIFCVIAAFFVLGSRDFLALMKTTRYAAAQISNIYFAKEVNYFAEGNDLSPLLHTWSLGVEEQFYLFWPLILFGFSKLGAARVQKFSLVALCVLSFGLSVYMVNKLPKMAFYFMPSRLWELGLGGLLGMGFFPLTGNKKIAELMSLSGLGLVFSSAFMLDGESLFPGVNAIYSVVGSALLIYATPVADVSRKLLSLKPLVFVGKISYSLYLWHWPLIVFVKNYTQQEIPMGIGLGIFVISFPMAYFSWKFVENPFRHLTKKESGYQWKVIGAGVLTIVLMIVGANGVKVFHDSDFRFLGKPLVADNNIHGAHDKCGYSEHHLREGIDLYKTENCSHNTSNRKRRAVIFGDSHASHLFPAFEKIAKEKDLNVGLLVSSSCPSFWGGFNMYQRNKHIQRCGIFSDYAKKTILGDSSIEYVVISMRASQYTETSDNEEASVRTFLVDSKNGDFSVENSRRVYEEKLEATVKEILNAGKKVILFGQAPMLQKDPIRCIENSRVLVSKLFKVSEERCFQFNWPWVEKRLSHSNGVFERLAKKYDLHLTIPRKYIESAKHENQLIYFDDNHLNVRGSKYIGSQIPIDSLLRQ